MFTVSSCRQSTAAEGSLMKSWYCCQCPVHFSKFTSAPRGPRLRSTRLSSSPSHRHRRRSVSCRSSFRMLHDLGILQGLIESAIYLRRRITLSRFSVFRSTFPLLPGRLATAAAREETTACSKGIRKEGHTTEHIIFSVSTPLISRLRCRDTPRSAQQEQLAAG